MMKYSKKLSFLLELAVLQFNSCNEIRFGSFRGLSQTSSRFYQTFKTIEGISLPECAVQGANEGVSGINFRADSSECELIKGMSGCTGNATGWQAFRSCDIETAGPGYKSVTQSSEHSNYRPASLAVDGDYDTISVTAQQPLVDQPWWMLEFCYDASVTGVRIWNRKDAYKDQLSNLDITVDDLLCGHMSDAPELGESKDVMCPRTLTGTFLKIQKMDKNVLNIAEIQTILSNDGSNGC